MTTPDQPWTLLTQYWPLPVAILVVYFFSKSHFNSPDYPLSGYALADSATPDLPRNSSSARLRTPAPPIFTTPRDRYRWAELKYIIGVEAAFVFLAFFPDLVAKIPGLEKISAIMGDSLHSHIVVATLLVTGVLSSFPVIRDADASFLKFLHTSASIPDDAEETASELFDAEYNPDPDVFRQIAGQIRSPTMRAVAMGDTIGVLEDRWLRIRCLAETLKQLQQSKRYRQFKAKFGPEFQDIYASVLRLREAVIRYEETQDAVLPSREPDIDLWFEHNASGNPIASSLKRDRDKLMFDVESLHYRICLFASLMAYAVESTDDNINSCLKDFGFEIQIVSPPRRPWDILIVGGFATMLVCLLISGIYTVFVHMMVDIPARYRAEVPAHLGEAGFWSVLTCILHTTAAGIATFLTIGKIKRLKADRRPLAWENPLTLSVFFAAVASLAPIGIIGLYALRYGLPWQVMLWAGLPFISALFSVRYVRASVEHASSLDFNYPLLQACVMGLTAFLLGVIVVPIEPDPWDWPAIVWVFSAYAALVAAAIGLALGIVFQRQLAANVNRIFVSEQGASRRRILFVPKAVE